MKKMSLIDKKAALIAAERITEFMSVPPLATREWAVERAKSIINALPTIQTERKSGKWIETEENHGFDDEVREKAVACSVCHVAFKRSDYVVEDFRYCPNCGARMREE